MGNRSEPDRNVSPPKRSNRRTAGRLTARRDSTASVHTAPRNHDLAKVVSKYSVNFFRFPWIRCLHTLPPPSRIARFFRRPVEPDDFTTGPIRGDLLGEEHLAERARMLARGQVVAVDRGPRLSARLLARLHNTRGVLADAHAQILRANAESIDVGATDDPKLRSDAIPSTPLPLSGMVVLGRFSISLGIHSIAVSPRFCIANA